MAFAAFSTTTAALSEAVPRRRSKVALLLQDPYTMLNPLMGRYGHPVNGVMVVNIDYSNPEHRKAILGALAEKVEVYRDVPGVLMWLLGNENNYGLHWTSFEIEALPGHGLPG